jgi:hypothetical protein
MPTVSFDNVSTLEADREKASFEGKGQAEVLSFCFLGTSHDVQGERNALVYSLHAAIYLFRQTLYFALVKSFFNKPSELISCPISESVEQADT